MFGQCSFFIGVFLLLAILKKLFRKIDTAMEQIDKEAKIYVFFYCGITAVQVQSAFRVILFFRKISNQFFEHEIGYSAKPMNDSRNFV